MGKRKEYRINLDAVEASLRQVQADFDTINMHLLMRREPLTDTIIDNLLEGYAYVDLLLEQGTDLFDSRGAGHILELNHCVLCGVGHECRLEYTGHIMETRKKFYNLIGDILRWYQAHLSKSPFRRAAGVYVMGVSQPQLFIEGNHRTEALLASYILVQAGKPPFVLSRENAVAYFNPSTLIKSKSKEKLLDKHYYMHKYKKYFAKFLEENLDKQYRKKVYVEE